MKAAKDLSVLLLAGILVLAGLGACSNPAGTVAAGTDGATAAAPAATVVSGTIGVAEVSGAIRLSLSGAAARAAGSPASTATLKLVDPKTLAMVDAALSGSFDPATGVFSLGGEVSLSATAGSPARTWLVAVAGTYDSASGKVSFSKVEFTDKSAPATVLSGTSSAARTSGSLRTYTGSYNPGNRIPGLAGMPISLVPSATITCVLSDSTYDFTLSGTASVSFAQASGGPKTGSAQLYLTQAGSRSGADLTGTSAGRLALTMPQYSPAAGWTAQTTAIDTPAAARTVAGMFVESGDTLSLMGKYSLSLVK